MLRLSFLLADDCSVLSSVGVLHPNTALLADNIAPACLSKNSFDEQKCQAQIDALYSCCNAFYEKFGDDAKTVSCPMANLLRLKIEQRKDAR